LVAAGACLAAAADVRVVEEIAARVNGEIITRGELDQKRKQIEQQLRSDGYNGARLTDALKDTAANALRDQIDEILLVQRGKDLDIKIDTEVTKRLAEYQVQAKIADPDKFHDMIRQQYGMPFEDFRDQMRRSLMAQRVIGQEVSYRISIPEADMQKYYEEHKGDYVRQEQVFLSQLVISTEGKTPEQVAAAEKKAKELVVRANKGEKFSELVEKNSDDAETAKNGGQMPPMQRGMLIKPIEDIVFKAKKGTVTDPIKIPTGFVILKIEDRYDPGQAPFEEVKNDIHEKLAAPKMEPKVREFLTQLRQQAFLEIKDGYVDSGAAPGKDTRWKDVAQLKPQTVTKEEVAARPRKKRLLFVPIPGTQVKRKIEPDAANPQAPAVTGAPAPAPAAAPAGAPEKPSGGSSTPTGKQ
jgi:peptidyl-prolyl cis-trans isomerase SurA